MQHEMSGEEIFIYLAFGVIVVVAGSCFLWREAKEIFREMRAETLDSDFTEITRRNAR